MTYEGARIDVEMCTGCGKCYDNCPYEAIVPYETDDGPGKEPKDDQVPND